MYHSRRSKKSVKKLHFSLYIVKTLFSLHKILKFTSGCWRRALDYFARKNVTSSLLYSFLVVVVVVVKDLIPFRGGN